MPLTQLPPGALGTVVRGGSQHPSLLPVLGCQSWVAVAASVGLQRVLWETLTDGGLRGLHCRGSSGGQTSSEMLRIGAATSPITRVPPGHCRGHNSVCAAAASMAGLPGDLSGFTFQLGVCDCKRDLPHPPPRGLAHTLPSANIDNNLRARRSGRCSTAMR